MMSIIGAAAIVVKSATGPITATGIWTLVGLMLTTVATIVVAFFRYRPKFKEIVNAARRDEMLAMGLRITELEGKVDAATTVATAAGERAHASELKSTTLATAVQLLLDEMRRVDPDSPVIKQAENLVILAMSNDGGIGEAMKRLASIPSIITPADRNGAT